jgi:hypothetical protein
VIFHRFLYVYQRVQFKVKHFTNEKNIKKTVLVDLAQLVLTQVGCGRHCHLCILDFGTLAEAAKKMARG